MELLVHLSRNMEIRSLRSPDVLQLSNKFSLLEEKDFFLHSDCCSLTSSPKSDKCLVSTPLSMAILKPWLSSVVHCSNLAWFSLPLPFHKPLFQSTNSKGLSQSSILSLHDLPSFYLSGNEWNQSEI